MLNDGIRIFRSNNIFDVIDYLEKSQARTLICLGLFFAPFEGNFRLNFS